MTCDFCSAFEWHRYDSTLRVVLADVDAFDTHVYEMINADNVKYCPMCGKELWVGEE